MAETRDTADREKLAHVCRKHHIRRLSLFGSRLSGEAGRTRVEHKDQALAEARRLLPVDDRTNGTKMVIWDTATRSTAKATPTTPAPICASPSAP